MNNDDDRAVAVSCVVFERYGEYNENENEKWGHKLEDTYVMGGGRERKRPILMVRP